MDDQRRARLALICLFVAIVLIVIIQFVYVSSQSPLERLQRVFDYSLDGIEVSVEDSYIDTAFMDGWRVYVVSVNGNREGTLFDEQQMTDGIPEHQQQVINQRNEEIINRGKVPLFTIIPDHDYKTLRLLAIEAKSELYVIKDMETDLFYVIKQKFR